MSSLRICSLIIFCYLGVVDFGWAQLRNTAPETIQSCYKNATALNRANRQPMHINHLIAIIRKIEEKSAYLWDVRRVARLLVKRFQFDGIYHDPDKSLDLQYSPHPLESLKDRIIHDLIPDNADILPNDFLDNDERCALHWMLSHSLNAMMRDDEDIERYQGPRYSGALRAKRAIQKITNRPVETGTVYTDWGPISAGRLIAGIAAGLMEHSIPVVFKYDGVDIGNQYPPNSGSGGSGNGGGNSGGGNENPDWRNNPQNRNNNGNNPQYNSNPWQTQGRKKRQAGITFQNLRNVYAATLGGDIGQAAMLNAPYYQIISGMSPPVGSWNDTICPREYILNALPSSQVDPSRGYDTWTYMTGSEIRGGMDGLILASRIKDLSAKGFTLSQILEMYYSEDGIYGDNNVKSCERVSLFSSAADPNTLKEQSRSFAYLYNTKIVKVVVDQTSNIFNTLVDQAYSKMISFQSTLSSDPQCKKRLIGGGNTIPDEDKPTDPMVYIYTVLDHSVTRDELIAQQRFVGKLAFDLNVSPEGSRLGLVDGRTGQVLISPNYTDNAPILACKIIGQPQALQPSNLAQVLRTLKAEFVRLRIERERRGEIGSRITVLVFVQGKKLEETQRSSILNILEEYEAFGDIQVTYTSSKYREEDFHNFMLRKDSSLFIPIQSQGSGNLSDSTSLFLKEFLKTSHSSFGYPQCNEYKFPNQGDELLKGYDIFIKPTYIQYYTISPTQFFSSVDLRLRFSSDYGKVRICVSQEGKYPIQYDDRQNEDRGIQCGTTSGIYQPPESMKKDVEFIITKPCRYRERKDCSPIYISITSTDVPIPTGSLGTDCTQGGCDTMGLVKVTWTHYDMRCNDALKTRLSLPLAILSILSTVLLFNRS